MRATDFRLDHMFRHTRSRENSFRGPLKAIFFFLVVCMATLSSAATPTDNPVAAYYDGPEGYPAWTDMIRWSNVIDMSRYEKGATQFEKFENARDELAAEGGGVLYYPAGVYDFTKGPFDGPAGRGLLLKEGVVIRGQRPSGKPCAARDGELELGTQFEFGFRTRGGGKVPRDWNLIGLHTDESGRSPDLIGICWVHLDGAVIHFGPDFDWGKTWKKAGGWRSFYVKDSWANRKADGTHPLDAYMAGPVYVESNHGRDPDGTPYEGSPGIEPVENADRFLGSGFGRLVFGCVLENSCMTNDVETCGRKESREGFGPDGFHMARYVGRIGAYGSRVLVANNLLAKSPKHCFGYEQTTVRTQPGRGNDYRILDTRTSRVLFDYGRVLGIDINKDMLATMQGLLEDRNSGGFFAEGVVVQDNYVFNHGHKGFNLSGKWMVVRRNYNARKMLKSGEDPYGIGDWRLTLEGFVESAGGGGGMISDNYSRAFDLAGRNLWVDGNYYENLGSSPGNDGEGILCQHHNGTHWYSWAVTHNRHQKGDGKSGYIGAWATRMHGALIAWNETAGWVGIAASNDTADLAFVANEAESVKYGKRELVVEPPRGVPKAPGTVKADLYERDAVLIEWQDNADNEIGFRIERRIEDGPWCAIAYRPPRIEGSQDNPQTWVDFLAPCGRPLRYRVVAISVKDSDQGASEAVGPVVIRKFR